MSYWSSDMCSSDLYTYDALDRVTHKNLPGSELDIDYAYDNLGRLTAANQTSGANDLTFTYDAPGRNLPQAGPRGKKTSTADAAGRRTELPWPDRKRQRLKPRPSCEYRMRLSDCKQQNTI